MSKELTEQWRNGTLENDYYYVHIKLDEHSEYDDIDRIDELTGNFELHCDDYIKEVLAPVPTYNQFVELTEKVEQLEQDNKCLKSGIDTYESQLSRISEQLKEANDVLKQIADTRNFQYGHKFAQSYIKRWGVK